MSRLFDLVPAERPEPEPELARKGWRAADLSEDELVNDGIIEDDPSSFVVPPPEVGR